MKKNLSYRQTLIELGRIYKIDKVLNKNLKLTTYEIELEILRNNVPIPSRRGYLSHKIINEILQPFYSHLKEKLSINLNLNKNLKKIQNNFSNSLKEKLSINFNFSKYSKKVSNNINSYFNFVVFNINNFFKVLSKTIIDSLNNIYHFKIEEKLVNKYLMRGAYSLFFVMLVSGGFYIKSLVTNVDSLKISVEIKSDKRKIEQTEDVAKKNTSKNLTKKPKVAKKPYDPENDYTLNTQTVLNLFEDLEYDLDHVRNKKSVKPIYFTRLPKDLNTIKSVKEKKKLFYKSYYL